MKINPVLVKRFTGPDGKKNLIEALQRQEIVNGVLTLAKRLSKVVDLVEYKKGRFIIRQGQSDSDLFFILRGSVSIHVNGRQIASRTAGQQIGEMALIDNTALRSADVIANELSVCAKLTEKKFNAIADKEPMIWRQMAVILIKRLTERNKFHPVPRSQPVVFIGSSKEGIKVADCINKYLLRFKIVPRIWTEDVFEASNTAIEDLYKQISETDFSVIILTPDDMTKSRKKRKPSPRDNLIFELGLFMGGLGRERTYFVIPQNIDLKIPTDLLGVTRLEFKYRGRGSISSRLKNVKDNLKRLILKHGPR